MVQRQDETAEQSYVVGKRPTIRGGTDNSSLSARRRSSALGSSGAPTPPPSLCSGMSTVVGGIDNGVIDDETTGEYGAGDAGGYSVGVVGVGGAADDSVTRQLQCRTVPTDEKGVII